MNHPEKQKKQFVNQYMAEKAGMSEVDKTKITEIIQSLTEGSPKSLYQKQMAQKRELQLAEMLRKTLQFTIEQKKQIKIDWQEEIQKMSKQRNLSKYWAHLDFDMFYVACEMLDKPQLKDKPTAVGGESSVVCTANYIARKYGVRSAIPTFIAKKLCPQLILIPPDFSKYKKYSNIFRDILRKFDKDLESMGLDEAYVQLTDFMKDKTLQEQQTFINSIRQDIFNQTGLTVSCGVGANKMLAKLASEQKKPNGQFILENKEDKILEFMKTKKIRKIPGIGPVNEFFLKGLGIQTAGDVLQNTDALTICFSSNSVQFYISAALGIGQTEHEFVQRKSLGKSETFKSTNDQKYLCNKIIEIVQQVSMELEQLGYLTKNIVFSYQTQLFSKKDKTFQLVKYTSKKQDLTEYVLPYLKDMIETKKQKLRLLGARCTNIIKIQDLRKIQLDKYLVKEGQHDSFTEEMKKEKGEKNVLNFFCPICNEEIDCKGNLAAFNRHIDRCMSKDFKDKHLDEKDNQKVHNQNGQRVRKTSQILQTEKEKGDKKGPKSENILSFFKKKVNQTSVKF